MNINVESQEAILSRDIVIVPKIAKKASKINYMSVKRVFDLVISTIGLIILSPIFLILAIIVKLDSKGPVFFAHTRYGKNGKKFKMYKFRTMYENAQDMINDFTPEQMKEWKENFKLQDDLSIIGPRPVIEEELEKYGENKEKFLSVTPGLTGYWQANGRSSTTYEQRMEMELYYIDHISPKLDFKIFFKTIESVIKKEGAIK